MDTIENAGLGESQIVVLIGETVDFTFVQNLGFATTEELDAAFNSTSSGLGAKVDKVGGTLGTPFVKYQSTGTAQANPYLMFKETNSGSGERDIELAGNRVILNAAYAVRFVSAIAEFTAGINWDFGGQSVSLAGAGVFSVTTSSANVKVIDCGVGKDMVFRNYDDTKKVIVKGQSTMTVPIFEVQRSDGTVAMQVKDVARPTYSASDTAAQLGQKLKDLGILS